MSKSRRPLLTLRLQRNPSKQQFFLFFSILVCGSLLPVTLGYLDVSGGREMSSSSLPRRHNDDVVESLAPSSFDETAGVPFQLFPHSLRHQEHYNHRIEQAVDDFKRSQQKKPQQEYQLFRNFSQVFPSSTSSSVYLRHQHHQKVPFTKDKNQQTLSSTSHHLRHHNRHHEAWENRVFPALRHHHEQQQQQQQQQQEQQPLTPPSPTQTMMMMMMTPTTTESSRDIALTMSRSRFNSKSNLTSTLQSRLFDRDSLYRDGDVDQSYKTKTTRGPRSRHNYGSGSYSLHDRPFSDDPRFARGLGGADLNRNRFLPPSANRYSLKLDDSRIDNNNEEYDNVNDSNEDDDDEDDDDDGDDYYSYDDSSEEDPEYFALMKRRKQSQAAARNADGSWRRQQKSNIDNENDDGTNNDEDFSKDKWNRIQEEHQIKQQLHQKELEALRQHQRPWQTQRNGGSSTGKYSVPPPPAARAASSTKRQIHNNDDSENIYSRYNIPGTLTHHKFQELGTHEAVKQSRKAHSTNHMQNKALANAHVSKIYSEASCRLPQRRVERIQKDPSKMYVPHCTVLHRCADDTGCCMTDRQTCAPKRTQSVDLYFFVKSINSKQGSIERHTFINHTECHCVDSSKHRHGEFGGGLTEGANGMPPAQLMRKATVLNCNCPKLYEKILQEDGFCRCDCSSGNIGCDFLKRGMEHFSMVDRKCIIEGRCKPPTCEFGAYIKKHGRCPRREEQMAAGSALRNYN